MTERAMTVSDQLKKIVISSSGCWEFSGNRDKNGYGIFGFKQKRAHRVSYEVHNGPIPYGMLVCHKCDNPPCINPAHLFLGTPKDNMIDKVNKGRASKFFGEKNPMSKLTDAERNEIVVLRSTGLKLKDIASKYSTSIQNVSKIIIMGKLCQTI